MENQPPRISIRRRIFRFFSKNFFLVVLIVVAASVVASFELGRYSVYRANPGFAGAEQASAILKKVGKLIRLPSGEMPQMAEISDAAGAKAGQPFLKDAMNGDILIVYPNAAEALLYRPSTDQLVAVGPVTSQTGTTRGTTPVNEPLTSESDATTTHATSTKK